MSEIEGIQALLSKFIMSIAEFQGLIIPFFFFFKSSWEKKLMQLKKINLGFFVIWTVN